MSFGIELGRGDYRQKETWEWSQPKWKANKMCTAFGNDGILLFSVPKSKERRLLGSQIIELASGQTGQAHTFWADGNPRLALDYGSAAAVCKVEKNLRKTKVYEWLNSPVAC